jgi:hypothetical protein
MANELIIKAYSDKYYRLREWKKERVVSGLRVMMEHLPQLPNEYDDVTQSDFGDLWIKYPYNRELREQLKRLFLDAGWVVYWEVSESEISSDKAGEPRISFKYQDAENWKEEANVILEFSTFSKKSVCTRKQVGTVSKDFPVYDYTCKEGE